MSTANGQQLGASFFQSFEVGGIGELDIETRCQSVQEMNLPGLALADKIGEVGQCATGIRLPPEHPMMKVVLGPVHVGIEPGVGQVLKQVAPFLRIPRGSVEPFDDARKEIGGQG